MVINALKWLVTFLETRFPAKVTPVAKEAFDGLDSTVRNQSKQIEEMKKQIETLNLRVGLSRPMQTVLRTKSNG